MNTSRNIGILTQKQQLQLQETKVAVLGLGMGGNIAELLVRTGFRKIAIVDGDTVSPSNLNRQIYTNKDIGRKKADCLAIRLLSIDNNLELDVINEYLPRNLSNMPTADLVIDTIDLSNIDTIIALHSLMREKGIPIIFPFNVGWRSIATVFSSGSITLEQMLEIDDETIDKVSVRDFSFWATFLGRYVPSYGLEQYKKFVERASRMSDWCPAPQLGSTVWTTAALTTTLAVKIVTGQKTILAPEVKELDLFL